MVVVDNARRMISRNIDVVVTSVLQTTAGKMIFGRYIEGGGCARRLQSVPRARRPAGAGGASVEVRLPPVPLVADGLLPDPGHQRLHHRARHGVAALDAFRSERRLRPPVRARLGVADPEDHRRPRVASRASSTSTRAQLRVRGEPPEHLRHPDRVHDAAAAAADRREGVARPLSVPRLAPAAHRAPAGRSQEPRGRHPEEDGEARGGARSLIVFPEGTRSVDGRSAGSRAASFCSRSTPASGRAAQHRAEPLRDDERAADGASGRTSPSRSRADRDDRLAREQARALADESARSSAATSTSRSPTEALRRA